MPPSEHLFQTMFIFDPLMQWLCGPFSCHSLPVKWKKLFRRKKSQTYWTASKNAESSSRWLLSYVQTNVYDLLDQFYNHNLQAVASRQTHFHDSNEFIQWQLHSRYMRYDNFVDKLSSINFNLPNTQHNGMSRHNMISMFRTRDKKLQMLLLTIYFDEWELRWLSYLCRRVESYQRVMLMPMMIGDNVLQCLHIVIGSLQILLL